jgi:hypothetical protein
MYEILKIVNPDLSSPAGCSVYFLILRSWVTDLGSELYFPMKYFEKKEKKDFYQAFEEIRTKIFKIRDAIPINGTISDYEKFTCQAINNIKEIHNTMLFVAAAMGEDDKWILTCSLTRQPSGVLKSWFNYLGLFEMALKDFNPRIRKNQ